MSFIFKSDKNEKPAIDDESEDDPHHKRMGKAMSLCIAYSANCGGIGSLTGTGPNLVLKGQADMWVYFYFLPFAGYLLWFYPVRPSVRPSQYCIRYKSSISLDALLSNMLQNVNQYKMIRRKQKSRLKVINCKLINNSSTMLGTKCIFISKKLLSLK